MTSITLSYFGPPEQKVPIKVPPMQTLGDALAAAAAKFRPPLQPGAVELRLHKRAVDLSTPFRLLNVPAGSKLEVIKKAAPVAAAAAPATSAAAAVPTATAAPLAAAAAPPAQPPPAAPAPSPAPAAAPAAPKVSFVPPAAPAQAAAAAAGPSSSAAAAADAEPSPLAALGVAGPVHVFHHRTLEAAAARAPSAAALDPPDDFFELTPDDFARLQQQANAKKKQEATFRTRTAREAEAAARASSLGPVRVRLHFPDGTLLQAQFRATDALAAVQDLVRRCAAPGAAQSLYLYTTPPKTLLKDPGASLYGLQLVPAAHIYVGCDEAKLPPGASAAQLLRPEVLALMRNSVPEQPAHEAPGRDEQRGGGGGGGPAGGRDAVAEAQRAAAESRQLAGGGGGVADAGGPKVPKWLKLGKK